MNSLVALLKKLFRRLSRRLPNTIKRLMVLSSMTSLLSIEDENSDFIRALNAMIIKAKEEDAVRFARSVTKWIWEDGSLRIDPQHPMDTSEILTQIPQVFQYADKDTMQDDLQRVIEFTRDYKPS